MTEEIEVAPNIIIPNRDFLVGSIYGFNLAKKMHGVTNPEVSQTKEGETNFFIGYWLEISCIKCKRMYCFEGPNDLPLSNLICETPDCGNHLIVYNVADSKLWKIGHLKFN